MSVSLFTISQPRYDNLLWKVLSFYCLFLLARCDWGFGGSVFGGFLLFLDILSLLV